MYICIYSLPNLSTFKFPFSSPFLSPIPFFTLVFFPNFLAYITIGQKKLKTKFFTYTTYIFIIKPQMPYTYAKQGSKYTVYKEKKGGERGEKVGSTEGTKEALKKYLAALHANETTNENMIPKWVADLFKTKKEKRSEKEHEALLRWADENNLSPERAKAMAAVLAKVDPDTGRIPTGVNTGNIDESLVSKINDDGYKTWKYTDSNGKEYRAYGKNENGAKDYLTLRYELKDVDTSKIELTRRGVGYVDPYLEAIYKGTTDTIVKKELPLFTAENRSIMRVNQLREIVKELMAADMPPTEKVSAMPGQDVKDQMIAAVSSTNDPKVLMQLAIKFGGAGFKESDNLGEMKRKLTPYMSKAGASEYLKLAQLFAVENGQIVMKGGKQDIMFTNAKETKMNKKDLMEMIREVIAEEAGMVQVVLPGEGVIASVTPEQKVELDGKAFRKEELKAFGIDHEAIRDDAWYQLSGDKSLLLKAILDYIPDNPYSHKKVTENKTKMKVNQLRQIIREEISKVLNESKPNNRIGWDKGFQTSIEFNEDLANLLKRIADEGTTITKAQLKQAVDKAGSQGYDEWDRIIGSKSEDPYTIKILPDKIQISGTKGGAISKNMQSSFDKYGTNLGGK